MAGGGTLLSLVPFRSGQKLTFGWACDRKRFAAGTGKTLSLICSSLQWLEDARRREQQAAASGSDGRAPGVTDVTNNVTAADDDDEPDWLRDYSANKEEEARRKAQERRQQQLAAVRAGLVQRQQKRDAAAQVRQGRLPKCIAGLLLQLGDLLARHALLL
jgi:hypothetical protein